MIDLSLTTAQQDIVEKYRDFTAKYIIPNARKYDLEAVFPWEVVKKAYEEGIMNGPMTSEQLAEATGTTERYVREWLSAQAASGFVEYHRENSDLSYEKIVKRKKKKLRL